MQNPYDTNFDAPDAHFDNFSDAQAETFGNPKYYDCKDPKRLPCNGAKSVEV
jgi:hypothetical protein